MLHRRLMITALTATLLGGGAVAAGAAPAKIQATPAPGTACTADDLGKRFHWIETAEVTPTITHYTAVNVTEGTTGQREYELTQQTVVTTEVNRSAEIGTGAEALLKLVSIKVNFSVKTTKATTATERLKIVWNFNLPGYYGLYKGTRRIEGTHVSLNCAAVSRPGEPERTEWVRRPGGTFTTFSFIEEGSISCNDTVPVGTLRALAKAQLGCEPGTKPKPKPKTDQVAQVASPASDVGVQGLPTGFVCEPGYYRIMTKSGNALTGQTRDVRFEPWTVHNAQHWRVCHSSAPAEFPEYAFVTKQRGLCLQLHDSRLDDGAILNLYSCKGGAENKNFRFYVYKDVASSTAIGIQNQHSMSMVAPMNGDLSAGVSVGQYEAGQDNGSGTFNLLKI
jgi:hypothetical protein